MGTSNGYTIRLATETDVDALIALREEAETWLAERGIEQWTSQWNDVGRAKIRQSVVLGETWAIEDDSSTVATVTLTTRADTDFWTPDTDGPALYLHKLIVARSHSGQGLGGEIVDWSTDHAARQGFPCVRLDVWRDNFRLHRYYLDQGFKHIRTVDVSGRDSGACFERPAMRINTNFRLAKDRG